MTEEERMEILRMLTQGGSVKIGQLSVGDHNTLNYNEAKEECKTAREVTPNDVVTVIKSGRVILPTDGSITVLYAVCRDVYKWEIGQSEFERTMSIQGINCTPGTIANTLRKHPYMRDHVDKWAVLGAKQDVLKLRDNFIEAVELLPSAASET